MSSRILAPIEEDSEQADPENEAPVGTIRGANGSKELSKGGLAGVILGGAAVAAGAAALAIRQKGLASA